MQIFTTIKERQKLVLEKYLQQSKISSKPSNSDAVKMAYSMASVKPTSKETNSKRL